MSYIPYHIAYNIEYTIYYNIIYYIATPEALNAGEVGKPW